MKRVTTTWVCDLCGRESTDPSIFKQVNVRHLGLTKPTMDLATGILVLKDEYKDICENCIESIKELVKEKPLG